MGQQKEVKLPTVPTNKTPPPQKKHLGDSMKHLPGSTQHGHRSSIFPGQEHQSRLPRDTATRRPSGRPRSRREPRPSRGPALRRQRVCDGDGGDGGFGRDDARGKRKLKSSLRQEDWVCEDTSSDMCCFPWGKISKKHRVAFPTVAGLGEVTAHPLRSQWSQRKTKGFGPNVQRCSKNSPLLVNAAQRRGHPRMSAASALTGRRVRTSAAGSAD